MNAVTDILPSDPAPLDSAIARAEARMRDLEEVRQICMSIARVVQKQALAQADLQDTIDKVAGASEVVGSNIVTLAVRGDFGLVIDRVARSVRLTVMLEEKLEKIIRDRKAALAAGSLVARRRRDAVERVVMTAIHDKHPRSDDKVERDREHLNHYLGREDFVERPVSEIVRRLCDVLGLRPDWNRWADEPWADEEAEAGVPGTPYEVAAPRAAKTAAVPPKPQTPPGAGPGPDSS